MEQRFLVVKPSSFGDIVHLFPTLALMRRKFPGAKLDFVVNPEFVPLLQFSPFPVSRVIVFERRKLGRISAFFPELFRLIRALRSERYDIAIDFQGLLRSALCLAPVRSQVKAGFAAPREAAAALFYRRKIAVAPGHAVERCFKLAAGVFGWPETEIPQPELPRSGAGRAALPPLPEKFFVLLPGTRWPSKRFPPELFAGIVRLLKRKFPGAGFVAAGGEAERKSADAIGENIINLAGKTSVESLFELLRASAGVFGNDSGPLHAAAALGVPTFGFYGPTDPELTGPYGPNGKSFSAGTACAKCLKRICPRGDLRCQQLDAAAIADAIAEAAGGKK